MTITGKCDTCRARKVKVGGCFLYLDASCDADRVQCDQQRPKCGSCRKRDRECTYLFGQVSAFVVEDPAQLSKHGRSKVAPIVYPVETGNESKTADSSIPASPASSALALRQNTSREADVGHGVFMTMSLPTRDKSKAPRRMTPQQRRNLQLHLHQLQNVPRRFTSTPMAIASRYVNLIETWPAEIQPFSILGSWVESIPARLGHSPAVDLAVEYFMQSYDVFQEKSFSKQWTALTTKARALKELQLVVANKETRRSYDTAIAMKLHFMAEVRCCIVHRRHAWLKI